MPMEEWIVLTQLTHTLTVVTTMIRPNLRIAWLHSSIVHITLSKAFIRFSLAPTSLAQIITKLKRQLTRSLTHHRLSSLNGVTLKMLTTVKWLLLLIKVWMVKSRYSYKPGEHQCTFTWCQTTSIRRYLTL